METQDLRVRNNEKLSKFCCQMIRIGSSTVLFDYQFLDLKTTYPIQKLKPI